MTYTTVGGDQGLLNRFFPRWERLPFTYNVHPGALVTKQAALAGAEKKYAGDCLLNVSVLLCVVRTRYRECVLHYGRRVLIFTYLNVK